MDPEVLEWLLRFPAFRPCVITTSNGEQHVIKHPEFARMIVDTVYVLADDKDPDGPSAGVAAVIAVMNICGVRGLNGPLAEPREPIRNPDNHND